MQYPAVTRRPQAAQALSRFILGAAAVATLAGAPPARADAAPDGLWHGAISLGGSLSSGNTRNRVLSGQGDAALKGVDDKLSIYGTANYATTSTNDVNTTSANAFKLGGRYDRDLNPDVFGFGTLELQSDKVTGLNLRDSAQLGLGYHVLKGDATTFDVFAGLGVAQARYTTLPSESGIEYLLGEESTHNLSKTTVFKQRLVSHIGASGLGRLTTWDLSLATSLVGQWTMNTGLSIRNSSVVAPGLKQTDTLLTVGLGYKF